jgi:transcriptional regulator with XRE-family HTH domain
MERLGFFSEKLMDGMAQSGWSQKTTAVRLGCSYEYVRKMVRGDSLPAPTLLKRLCSLFRWDATKIEKLVLLDRCRKQYGPTFWTVLGKNPRYEPLYILWPYLTPAEQQMVVHLMRTWIAQKGRLAAENLIAKGNPLLGCET